jgi:hypothetical protein
MKDINDLFEKLEQVERLYGISGVLIAIILIVAFILIWKFLTKTIENQAKITFDKELADYNKGILKELSMLNFEIGLLTNRKIGNVDKEREAILSYLNAYSYWLYGSLEIDILSFKYNNFEDINSILNKIREAYSESNQSWNKLKFWSTDERIIRASHELNMTLLKYSKYHETTLRKLRHNLSWGKLYSDQFQTIFKMIDRKKDWAEFLAAEDKRIIAENEKIIKEYWNGRKELFGEVVSKNIEFQTIARQYLKHDG